MKKIKKKGGGAPGTFQSMGLACTTALIAVNFTHPIEVVKTRMQVGNFNFGKMMRNEGPLSLFKGLPPAWLREASYTTVKLGGYAPIRKLYGADKKDSPFILKFLAGSTSGSIGAFVGNPFDVMKTMMMANAEKNVPLPKLMARMFKDQGASGFLRGVQANVMRACVLNGTKMGCYDFIKGKISKYTGWTRKDLRVQFCSAVGAGFLMTCTVSPFDMLRTTLMNQPTDKQLYNGFFDAAVKIVKSEGPLAFYRGFLPIWGRFAPQAMLQLIIFEKLLGLCGFDPI